MNEELHALYDEDLADARTFHGEESFLASQGRRQRASKILEAGGVRVAEDFLHATFIFQHGERLEHWAQAHLLARTAADLGHPRARYMVAASYDRWLMRQGRPQKYGTNSINDGGRARVWDYDPAVTDAERATWDVPPLAELLARAEQINQDLAAEQGQQPLVAVETQGVRVAIFDLAPAPELPVYGIHSYDPLPADEPRPAGLLPAATIWRFGRVRCAKELDGALVCSWHRCGWRLVDPPAGVTAAALLNQLGHAPQWLSAETACWQRLVLPVDEAECWIVGGCLPRDELARVAISL